MDNKHSPYADAEYYDTSATDTSAMLEGSAPEVDLLHSGDEYLDVSQLTQEELARVRSAWLDELKQIEEEIQTLRQVLASKLRRHHFLKRQVGITAMAELRDEFKQSIHQIRSSDAYQKTTAVVKAMKDKTSATLSEKWTNLKQTNVFKSFEETVGSAYSSVRGKLVRTNTSDHSTNHTDSTDKYAAPTLTFSLHGTANGDNTEVDDTALAAVSDFHATEEPKSPSTSPSELTTVELVGEQTKNVQETTDASLPDGSETQQTSPRKKNGGKRAPKTEPVKTDALNAGPL